MSTEKVKPLRPFSGNDKRVIIVRIYSFSGIGKQPPVGKRSGKAFTAQNPFKLSGTKDTVCMIEWRDAIEDWVLVEVTN